MLYELLIWTIILLKVVYLVEVVRTGIYKDKSLVRERDKILYISELLMYILLVIVFLKRGPIVITGHEKHIFVILGIVGITHMLSEN
jgi:hypothetical protein